MDKFYNYGVFNNIQAAKIYNSRLVLIKAKNKQKSEKSKQNSIELNNLNKSN